MGLHEMLFPYGWQWPALFGVTGAAMYALGRWDGKKAARKAWGDGGASQRKSDSLDKTAVQLNELKEVAEGWKPKSFSDDWPSPVKSRSREAPIPWDECIACGGALCYRTSAPDSHYADGDAVFCLEEGCEAKGVISCDDNAVSITWDEEWL